jgi:hypothetical protein
MGTLMPVDLLIGTDSIVSQFDFTDGNVTSFKYKTFDVNSIFTSNPFQNLQASVLSGPATLADIPQRSTDAVLETISTEPVTIPLPDHRVRLTLNGIIVWEWQVHFEAAVSTFRVDGVWNIV